MKASDVIRLQREFIVANAGEPIYAALAVMSVGMEANATPDMVEAFSWLVDQAFPNCK